MHDGEVQKLCKLAQYVLNRDRNRFFGRLADVLKRNCPSEDRQSQH